jgi:hypothetical protein
MMMLRHGLTQIRRDRGMQKIETQYLTEYELRVIMNDPHIRDNADLAENIVKLEAHCMAMLGSLLASEINMVAVFKSERHDALAGDILAKMVHYEYYKMAVPYGGFGSHYATEGYAEAKDIINRILDGKIRVHFPPYDYDHVTIKVTMKDTGDRAGILEALDILTESREGIKKAHTKLAALLAENIDFEAEQN